MELWKFEHNAVNLTLEINKKRENEEGIGLIIVLKDGRNISNLYKLSLNACKQAFSNGLGVVFHL